MNNNLGGFNFRPPIGPPAVYKATAIPNPAKRFVLLDEHKDNIDDACFGVWPAPDDRWLSLPSDRLSHGRNSSLADGHAEHWNWENRKTRASLNGAAVNEADLADSNRLQAAALSAKPIAKTQ
jgi:hypothetical protein